jgi:uncharacterized protein (DUF1501 family)
MGALQTEAEGKGANAPKGDDSTILVVVQMAGGNDGLNTLVPYANDHYHRARRRLNLARANLLKLDDDFALHAGMTGFKQLYDDGELGIVQGVGYPNPNRSHFRSTEIWQTASDSNKFETLGWIGRYFDHACKGADPTVGINVGRQNPQAFASKDPLGVTVQNPSTYRFIDPIRGTEKEMMAADKSLRALNQPDEDDGSLEFSSGDTIGGIAGKTMLQGSPLDFLERTALDAQVSSDEILKISAKSRNLADYPQSAFANSLRMVARLIGGGLSPRVFYLNQGGYDTHVNQAQAHERLLRELSGGLKAFVSDLKAQGNFDRVMVMTFSEFGRRVQENASGGTDHGAGSLLFTIGKKIKSGLLGKYPSLAPGDLTRGDLRHSVDFRSVYAAVLEQWLETDSAPVLGRKFDPIKLV